MKSRAFLTYMLGIVAGGMMEAPGLQPEVWIWSAVCFTIIWWKP